MSPRRKKILSTAATVAMSAGLLAIAFSNPQITFSQSSYGPQFTPQFIQQFTPPKSFVPPIVVPTDVTSQYPQAITAMMTPSGLAGAGLLAGFHTLGAEAFPSLDQLGGSPEFLEVKWEEGSVFTKPNLYSVSLTSGTVLVGVKKPSNTGLIQTPIGSAAIYSNADALVTFKNGVLRVANLDGTGDHVRINFNGQVYAIPPGVEFVAAERPLTKTDLRPPDDKLLRRNMQVIKGQNAAIVEFSVESSIEGSVLIAQLQSSNATDKDRRMLTDVSRMAAVLNHVAGTEGFSK